MSTRLARYRLVHTKEAWELVECVLNEYEVDLAQLVPVEYGIRIVAWTYEDVNPEQIAYEVSKAFFGCSVELELAYNPTSTFYPRRTTHEEETKNEANDTAGD